jgi:pimeloyl-ACP methyl ester carboxylesterase
MRTLCLSLLIAMSATAMETQVPMANDTVSSKTLLSALFPDAESWWPDIDLPSTEGLTLIRVITDASDGAVEAETHSEFLTLRIDTQKFRQHEKEVRTRIRQAFAEHFPKLAARAQASYGIRVHPAQGEAILLADSAPAAYAVVLIHGLDEPGRLWLGLIPTLLEAEHTVCEFTFPNDQPVAESAAFFYEWLERLRAKGVLRVSIVAHSMGGLISRELLTSPELYNGDGYGHPKLPDITRLIMVGTPNHGSPLARFRGFVEIRDQATRLANGDAQLLGGIFDGTGEAKVDLLPGSDFLLELNSRPPPRHTILSIFAGTASPFDLATIERMRAQLRAQLPEAMRPQIQQWCDGLQQLVTGVGDGAVSLDSAQIDGVTDTVHVEGNHLSIIRNVLPSSPRVPPAVPEILERLNTDRAWQCD